MCNLTITDRYILEMLKKHKFSSIRTFAKKVRCAPKTMVESLKRLEAAGEIRTHIELECCVAHKIVEVVGI